MRNLIAVSALLAALCACAAPPTPVEPLPSCPDPKSEPVDGGIGGTGNAEDDPCKTAQD